MNEQIRTCKAIRNDLEYITESVMSMGIKYINKFRQLYNTQQNCTDSLQDKFLDCYMERINCCYEEILVKYKKESVKHGKA